MDPTVWLAWAIPTSRLWRRVRPKRCVGRAARRLSHLSLQDPSLLQYGSRLTVNEEPTLWDSTCFSRNRVKAGKEGEIEREEKDKALATHFGSRHPSCTISRLLRHAVLTVALFFAPHPHGMGPEADTGELLSDMGG